ncbi:MAG: phosphate/phosphite/phosphonate ABC transporter substrate-binding protein [Gammaproteobacteria bacterium]|nr:phosphate/phosphite/phosphonate ABC transporter substrate-binding protein [Gammaproteobacteria bacterium]
MYSSKISALTTPLFGLLIGLSMLVSPLPEAHAADAERERTLVIGKISKNPKKHYKYLKPIGDYVVERMQDLGIDRVEVLMAKDNRQMINYLKRGKVDWVTETVFSSVELEDKAGAEIILVKHKKGVGQYHSVFFTRKDSGIESLQDLKGRVITFEDEGSTSAFFIPASILLDAGLELVRLESPRDSVDGDEVGYVFGKDEINMSTWVHKGLVNAGAYSNLDWEKGDHNPGSFKNDMKVFYQSESFPRAIEVVRKGLRPEVKQRLISVLLAAKDDENARAAMKAYQKTTQFDPIDDSIQAGIDRARGLKPGVEERLGL